MALYCPDTPPSFIIGPLSLFTSPSCLLWFRPFWPACIPSVAPFL
jgi:hypothetical protein